jgi:hypothetical protein
MTIPIIPWKSLTSVVSVGLTSEGWNLAEVPAGAPDLPRTYTLDVLFPEPFNTVPLVHASITGFDIDNRDTARISVAVNNVTTTGFHLAVTTWRGTRVYSVEVSWLVLGN